MMPPMKSILKSLLQTLMGLEGKNLKASNNFLAKSAQKVEGPTRGLSEKTIPGVTQACREEGGWVGELA